MGSSCLHCSHLGPTSAARRDTQRARAAVLGPLPALSPGFGSRRAVCCRRRSRCCPLWRAACRGGCCLPFSVLAAAGWAVALAVWDGHAVSQPRSRGPHEYLPASAGGRQRPCRIPRALRGRRRASATAGARQRSPAADGAGAVGLGPARRSRPWLGNCPGHRCRCVVGRRRRGRAPRARGRTGCAPGAALPHPRAIRHHGGDQRRRVLPRRRPRGPRRRSRLVACAGSWPLLAVAGLLAGALPYLSYGLLPYGAVLLAVGRLAVRRPRLARRLADAPDRLSGWHSLPA